MFTMTSSPGAQVTLCVTKVLTAIVSFCTMVALYNAIPLILSLPSREHLEREVHERKIAQSQLQEQFRRALLVREITENIRGQSKLKNVR